MSIATIGQLTARLPRRCKNAISTHTFTGLRKASRTSIKLSRKSLPQTSLSGLRGLPKTRGAIYPRTSPIWPSILFLDHPSFLDYSSYREICGGITAASLPLFLFAPAPFTRSRGAFLAVTASHTSPSDFAHFWCDVTALESTLV